MQTCMSKNVVNCNSVTVELPKSNHFNTKFVLKTPPTVVYINILPCLSDGDTTSKTCDECALFGE